MVWFALTVADDALTVNKTVDTVKEKTDEFTLTLEAFSKGTVATQTTVKPADIVLVLDQSASMYAPAGLEADAYYADKDDPRNVAIPDAAMLPDFVEKVQAGDETVLNNAKHLGYYIAVHNEYDYLYIVQYAEYATGKWGWFYVPVDVTATAVEVNTKDTTPDSDVALFNVLSGIWDSSGNPIYLVDGKRNPNLRDKFGTVAAKDRSFLAHLTYYKSQYGALYESVNNFVSELYKEAFENNVDHRIAIAGFGSPYYDGYENYDGTGLYIDGDYYLYDADHRYMGYKNANSTYGYTLYVPAEDYERMKGILPANLKGDVWTDTLPAGVTLVPLNPNTPGDSFIPNAEMTLPAVAGNAQYATALMPVKNADRSFNTNVSASIEAIKTNYLQTCPAIGLRMARSIFRGSEIPLADPGLANSATTAESLIQAADPTGALPEDRQQIIILFTDGVPTVSMYSNHEDGSTKNAEIRNEYWTGNGGVRDAINEANAAKREGIAVYTIGTSAADKVYGNKGEAATASPKVDFLNLASSNYPSSNSVYDVVTPSGDNTSVASYNLYVNYGKKSSGDYALFADVIMDLDTMFENIMESIIIPMASLEGSAALKEVLSDYFTLTQNSDNQYNISVFTAKYEGKDDQGKHQFSDELVPYENAEVEVLQGEDGRYDTIVIRNFDYSKEFVGTFDYGTDLNGVSHIVKRGRKLVVKVGVKVREGFWGGNNVPTNEDKTAIYTPEDEVFEKFPIPQVNIPLAVPAITGKNQVVYFKEPTLDLTDLVDTIQVDGVPVQAEGNGSFTMTHTQTWKNKFVDVVWNPASHLTNPSQAAVSSIKSNNYSFGVILKPKSGMTGTSNTEVNGSNIAGTPNSTDGVASNTATGHVDILVPLVTLQDSTVWIGEPITKAYVDAHNLVPGI